MGNFFLSFPLRSLIVWVFMSDVAIDVLVVNFCSVLHCGCVLCFFQLNKLFFFFSYLLKA
jgi:hypothetical protein